MAGNVWEWTHSKMKKYPYKADDGREAESASGNRVLRGGSFFDDVRVARCACRNVIGVITFGDYFGFRVVASPA